MDIASEKHLDFVCKSIQDIKNDYIKKENKVIAKHDNKIKLLHDYICKQNIIIKQLHDNSSKYEKQARQNSELLHEQISRSELLTGEVSRLNVKLDALSEELLEARESNYSGTLLWKIEDVSKHMSEAVDQSALSLYSPVFYTSRYGYRVRAQLFLNGIGSYEGEFMSIYFHILPSDHDDVLTWPFSKKITFALLDLSEESNKSDHISYTLVPSPSSTNFKRPSEKMSEGRGHNKFVLLEKLKSDQYVRNDCMFIKIRVHCKPSHKFENKESPS